MMFPNKGETALALEEMSGLLKTDDGFTKTILKKTIRMIPMKVKIIGYVETDLELDVQTKDYALNYL